MTYEEFKSRYHYDPDSDEDRLGEGGFGKVFKAYDTYRDRWVALKIAAVNPQYESVRLRKEVEMIGKLPVHPNIAYYEDCYTFSSFDGQYDFGILQYYQEGNLLQLIRKNILSPKQKQEILRQILNGISFLHTHGIIHRDLKPQNILIVKREKEYIPKITDFGISKRLDSNNSSVFSNSLVGAGTLAYSSPEQLKEDAIGKNTDLWSFGVIAYEVLTGKLPFSTGEHGASSEAGRQELFTRINKGGSGIPMTGIEEPWQKIIKGCLTVNPAERLKECADCLQLLEQKASAPVREETLIAPPPIKKEKLPPPPPPGQSGPVVSPGAGHSPVNRKKNNRTLIVTIGILVAAGIFCFFYFLILNDHSGEKPVGTNSNIPLEDIKEPIEYPIDSLMNDDDLLVPDSYDLPYTSRYRLTENELRGLSKQELRIMRNEIFARHGYIFDSKDLRDYFNSKSWYTPTSKNVSHLLNDIEKYNIDFIKKHE